MVPILDCDWTPGAPGLLLLETWETMNLNRPLESAGNLPRRCEAVQSDSVLIVPSLVQTVIATGAEKPALAFSRYAAQIFSTSESTDRLESPIARSPARHPFQFEGIDQ